jgi:hypothetical protein
MSGLFGTNPFRASTILTGPDESKKLSVWAKGHIIPNYNAAEYRRDDIGSAMRYGDYGNRDSDYGWEFDHHPVPTSLGGGDDVSNLRPLHWRNNVALGNKGGLGGLLGR